MDWKKRSACLVGKNILLSEVITIGQRKQLSSNYASKSACHMSLVLLSPTHFLLILLFNSRMDESHVKHILCLDHCWKISLCYLCKEESVTKYHGDSWTYIIFWRKPNNFNVVKVLVYQISAFNINFALLRLIHVILFSVFTCEKDKVSNHTKTLNSFCLSF